MNKRIMLYFILVFMILVSVTGCAVSFEGDKEQTVIPDKIENSKDYSDIQKEEKGNLPEDEIKKSEQDVTILYTGSDFIKSVFAVGEHMLYVCGMRDDGEFFLGLMPEEEEVFQEFTVDVEEGMRAFNMTVDCYGKCHILWMSVEKQKINGQSFDSITFEKSCITVVNKEGVVEKELDVSSVFSPKQPRPFCFVVDRDGNYYFENEKELIQITVDGIQKEAVICDGWIEGIGIGKSGAVFCTYHTETGERRIAGLEKNYLDTWAVQLPEADAIYAGIYAGTDTEILLFNKANGVFACDENKIENRISITELPVKGNEINGYGILSEGRICLMEQEEGKTLFYYLATGK